MISNTNSKSLKKVSILVDHNMVVDIDLAILKMIASDYRNRDVFNLDYLDYTDVRLIRYDLLTRESDNPLSIIMEEGYEDISDSLYNECILQEDLLKYISPTSFYTVLDRASSSDLNIDCLYRSEREIEYIKTLNDNNINMIKYSDTDIDRYDAIYIDDFRSILEFKLIPEGVNIYLSHKKKNDPITKEDVFLYKTISKCNEIKFIDLYDKNNILIPIEDEFYTNNLFTKKG